MGAVQEPVRARRAVLAVAAVPVVPVVPVDGRAVVGVVVGRVVVVVQSSPEAVDWLVAVEHPDAVDWLLAVEVPEAVDRSVAWASPDATDPPVAVAPPLVWANAGPASSPKTAAMLPTATRKAPARLVFIALPYCWSLER
jgi:hypothetical protein